MKRSEVTVVNGVQERRRKAKIALACVIVFVTVFTTVILLNRQPEEEKNPVRINNPGSPKQVKAREPEPIYLSPLTGQETTAERADRRPLVVVIENSPAARPQAGLASADLVYEVVAEGGITRFVAIYQQADDITIGPVRSARDYFVRIAKEFNGLFVHCGGSPTGYQEISRISVNSLDHFQNSEAYWRSSARRAPHNLYTNTDRLWRQAAKRSVATDGARAGFVFKSDAELKDRPDSGRIEVNFSGQTYRARFEYDPETNKYRRFMAGRAHIDPNTSGQIEVKNVIVQFVPMRVVDSAGRLAVENVGSGNALIFRDGKRIKATWQRDSVNDVTRFFDETDAEVKLNVGKTWIAFVAPDRAVNYE